MRTCWHKHKHKHKRKTISQSASTKAYVNDVLTEHKHKHKKKAYAYAYVAAVLTSAQASYAYVYAYACVASEGRALIRKGLTILVPRGGAPFCQHQENCDLRPVGSFFLSIRREFFSCSQPISFVRLERSMRKMTGTPWIADFRYGPSQRARFLVLTKGTRPLGTRMGT